MIGVGYETVVEREWDQLADRLDQVDADGVTIAVGRAEWVLFPWEDHERTWASGGEDLVADAIEALGEGREVTLVIDALAPEMIDHGPELAGVDEHGVASESFAGAAALDGYVGDEIAELCGAVAERYSPDRIALTELMLVDSFSEEDLALFVEQTGAEDWPRGDHGEIVVDSSVAAWRSAVIAGVVERCAEAADFVPVDMDVRVNWEDPSGDRADSGHDHALLAGVAEYLTAWNYFPLGGRDASYSSELTSGLAEALGAGAMDRVTMSVGLWTDGDEAAGSSQDGALSPDLMVEGLEYSLTNGVATVSVTPVSMMSAAHWDALAEWRG